MFVRILFHNLELGARLHKLNWNNKGIYTTYGMYIGHDSWTVTKRTVKILHGDLKFIGNINPNMIRFNN